MGRKRIHTMKKAGWEKVDIPSHMVDSMWQKDDMLHVIFATGQRFTFGQVDNDV